jgi:hypothetical protein
MRIDKSFEELFSRSLKPEEIPIHGVVSPFPSPQSQIGNGKYVLRIAINQPNSMNEQ